jgi:hypothetical protein
MGGDPHEFVPSERIGLETSLPCATSVPFPGGRRGVSAGGRQLIGARGIGRDRGAVVGKLSPGRPAAGPRRADLCSRGRRPARIRERSFCRAAGARATPGGRADAGLAACPSQRRLRARRCLALLDGRGDARLPAQTELRETPRPAEAVAEQPFHSFATDLVSRQVPVMQPLPAPASCVSEGDVNIRQACKAALRYLDTIHVDVV